MIDPRILRAASSHVHPHGRLARRMCGTALVALLWLAPAAALGGPKHDQGTWTSAFSLFPSGGLPTYPSDVTVHSVLLHGTGSTATLVYWGQSSTMHSWIYDPAVRDQSIFNNNFATPITATAMPVTDGSEFFCAGHAVLEDGRLLALGGQSAPGYDPRDPLWPTLLSKGSYFTGPTNTFAFDPSTASPNPPYGWTRLADFSEGRWYPTATTLGDGTLLLSSGIQGNDFICFGGETGTSTITNDLRVFEDFKTLNATSPALTSGSSPPGARTDYGAIFDDFASGNTPLNRTVIYGGRTSTGYTSELWQVRNREAEDDASITEKWTFSQLTPLSGSPIPPGRSYTDAAYDGVNDVSQSAFGSLVVIGGQGGTLASPTTLGDVWRFKFADRNPNTPDANSGTWVDVTPSSGLTLEPRYGNSSVRIPNPNGGSLPGWIVTLFGYNNSAPTPHYVNDGTSVWAFDLNTRTWAQRAVDDDPTFGHPSPREGASAVYDYYGSPDPQYSYCVLVFGGRNGSTYYNDTWRLNLSTTPNWKWKKIGPDCVTGDCLTVSPSARARAGIGIDTFNRKRILVFGGEDASGKLADAWALPVNYFGLEAAAKDKWLQLTINGSTEARAGHKLTWNRPGWTSRHLERFDPLAGTWSKYATAPMWTLTYPAVFQLPEDGKVFFSSLGYHSRWFDTAGSGAWSSGYISNPTEVANAGGLVGATAVMFRPGQVMQCGSYTAASFLEAVDLTTGTGSTSLPTYWSHSAPGDFPTGEGRYHHNLVSLPNGSVLVVGGTDGAPGVGQDLAHARRDPFLWTPDPVLASGTLTQMATEGQPRGYHSTAVLLPDARVLASGGSTVAFDLYGYDPGASTAEIYTPGYLYDSSDNPILLSARPQITSAPATLTYAASPATFTVNVSLGPGRTVAKVCLVRAGAVTHNFAMDQRFIPLGFTQAGNAVTVKKETTKYGALASLANGYTFADPVKGPRVAPPGWYMLFIVDDAGVPSVASWVKIDPVAPAAISLNLTAGCYDHIYASWIAPGDDGMIGNAAAYDLRVSTSTITELNWDQATPIWSGYPQPPGTQEQITIGAGCSRRYYAIKTRDAAYNWSPISNVPFGNAMCPHPPLQCEERARPAAHEESASPPALTLAAPIPNPTSGMAGTTFRFGVPTAKTGLPYDLSIFDLVGRKVATVDAGVSSAGYRSVTWDLRSQRGARVCGGVYFARLRLGAAALTQRVIVVH